MTRLSKPSKPYPDFPLFAHANGQWCKKIRGDLHYFGTWDDVDGAIEKYEREREALYAGRLPLDSGTVSVNDGCNIFLTSKLKLLQSGGITQRTYDDYELTAKRVIQAFGRGRRVASLVPDDFDSLRESLAKTLGPVALGNEINRVRMIFKYLVDTDVLDKAVKFGPHFKRPAAKLLRLAKAESGSKLVTADEINTLLTKANSRMKAMIYLGINCALGNSDIGHLKRSHIDFKGGWLNYPRPKTGIPRRAKLWAETVDSLKKVPQIQPTNEKHKDLFFVTSHGSPWYTDGHDNPVTKEFVKLVEKCKLKRAGLHFYSLRHTFQTIAEGAKDLPAVKQVMGHVPAANDMSSVYRQLIDDARLIAVSNYVRTWLKSSKKVSLKVS